MTAQKDTAVTIRYTLTGDDGALIDSSEQSGPLEYLHGSGYLLPKLEELITGKQEGDAFTAVLPPADGYGEYDQAMVVAVPRENFETAGTIEPGMQFHAETPGGMQVVTVKEVTDDAVVIDANHELAGKTLHFSVEVVAVRPATPEELEQGTPASGCGGCGGGCGGCGGSCGSGGYGSGADYEEEDGCSFCSCGCGG